MQSEQNTVQSTLPPAMSAAEIEASIAGEQCAACLKFKRRGQYFCVTDFSALSIPARLMLDRDRYGAFLSALRHLQLNVTRREAMGEGNWPYRSQDELEAAGFRMVKLHFRCEVPQPNSERVPPHTCGARITLWRTPKGTLMAIDDRSFRPHRLECADPQYFERKREEKLARKSTRRKRA